MRFFLTLFLSVVISVVLAQPTIKPDTKTLAAMEKVRFMEGKWSGAGWIKMGPQRSDFIQTEDVQLKVNGTVIVIDGLGVDPTTREVVHDAFAVLSYDAEQEMYLMRAIRGDGKNVDADAQVDDMGRFIWSFSHPIAGKVRYTIELENNKWVEVGEMNRGGTQWFKFFEMILEKVPKK